MFAPRFFRFFILVLWLGCFQVPSSCFATFITSSPGLTNRSNTDKTVMEIIATTSSLSSFTKALQAAELDKTLEGKGPFTVFAPSNAALTKLPPQTWQNLLKPENKDQLNAFLKYYIIPQKLLSSNLKEGPLPTMSYNSLQIKVVGSAIMINGANIIKANIVGNNGVVHIIDSVLLP